MGHPLHVVRVLEGSFASAENCFSISKHVASRSIVVYINETLMYECVRMFVRLKFACMKSALRH